MFARHERSFGARRPDALLGRMFAQTTRIMTIAQAALEAEGQNFRPNEATFSPWRDLTLPVAGRGRPGWWCDKQISAILSPTAKADLGARFRRAGDKMILSTPLASPTRKSLALPASSARSKVWSFRVAPIGNFRNGRTASRRIAGNGQVVLSFLYVAMNKGSTRATCAW